jgi:hypothetical protein
MAMPFAKSYPLSQKAQQPSLFIACLAVLLFCCTPVAAQLMPGAPPTLSNAPQRDTSTNKTNTSNWRTDDVQIHAFLAGSQQRYRPDSSIYSFHRRPFVQPWHRDLGNLGSPARNLLFTPDRYAGPTLGYHAFDVYRFQVDSLYYYNTTRPYSEFSFRLGSQAEQCAQILHTQNIKPNWNFALQYRKLTSPGYYKVQRNNHDNAAFATRYQSRNLKYTLHGAFAYNKQQHDANGGILADSLLDDERFRDRKTVAVRFENPSYSQLRSPVTNVQRDVAVLLQHGYTWGRTDTLYNEDSTQYSYKLVPRFGISHRLELSSEKFQYKDVRPDSLRYAPLFTASIARTDSVLMEQTWRRLDNSVALNGFVGPVDRQLQFTAGIGNRIDRFGTYFVADEDQSKWFSSYLTGSIRKEALGLGQWFYQADGRFYFAGQAAGDFLLHGGLGKDLGRDWGSLAVGIRQQLNEAPYSYTLYRNRFAEISTSMGKQSVTQLYGELSSARLRLSGGLRNYLIGNYIYLDSRQLPAQHAAAFNLTQLWFRKMFRFGIWALDNEVVVQQATDNAPVHVPLVMGRHQFGIETAIFAKALHISTGVEVRYHTAYFADGYSPFMGRFYYQDVYEVNNKPEASVYFNFRIKRFRAYIMGDQMQQIWFRNNITAPGHPAQNAMLRFGFSWVLIN